MIAFNIISHWILILIMTFGLLYFSFNNSRFKQYFINNCWVYIGFILLIFYHLTCIIRINILGFNFNDEKFRQWALMCGVIYLNSFYTSIISGRSSRFFDKINFLYSQIIIYAVTILLIRSDGLGYIFPDVHHIKESTIPDTLYTIVIDIILLIKIVFDIVYVRHIIRMKKWLYLKWCMIFMIIGLLFCTSWFSYFNSGFIGHIVNLLFSAPIYIFTILSYRQIESYQSHKKWGREV